MNPNVAINYDWTYETSLAYGLAVPLRLPSGQRCMFHVLADFRPPPRPYRDGELERYPLVKPQSFLLLTALGFRWLAMPQLRLKQVAVRWRDSRCQSYLDQPVDLVVGVFTQ
jgi:hypothetical protein